MKNIDEMAVLEIDHLTARPFIEKWHYSKKVPTGKNIFFGWYHSDFLYAVADYGIGVNPFQASFLSRVTGENVTNETLLELKRLCRTEPRRNVYLTQFLARCHKLLKTVGYKFIVSFSDPEHGHSGGIYKAANFAHLGRTNPEWHLVDSNGNKRHRRFAYRYSRRNGCTTDEARNALGLSRVKTLPKDRWFIRIGR